MPEPASKTARKTITKKDAVAAAAVEAVDGDVTVEFRGQQFVIPAATRLSWRVAMAIAAGAPHQLIFELISPDDHPRLLDVGEPGESFADVSEEFFKAYEAASGEGNS